MSYEKKRRKSKDNPYILRYDKKENKYLIDFKDLENKFYCVEVQSSIFQLFDEFELEDISQMNRYDRHIEHSEMTENTLYRRIKNKPKELEEVINEKMERERIDNAIKQLPLIQKKRIYMYYFCDLKQSDIAKIEKCSLRAVQYSIKIGLENLKKILE